MYSPKCILLLLAILEFQNFARYEGRFVCMSVCARACIYIQQKVWLLCKQVYNPNIKTQRIIKMSFSRIRRTFQPLSSCAITRSLVISVKLGQRGWGPQKCQSCSGNQVRQAETQLFEIAFHTWVKRWQEFPSCAADFGDDSFSVSGSLCKVCRHSDWDTR